MRESLNRLKTGGPTPQNSKQKTHGKVELDRIFILFGPSEHLRCDCLNHNHNFKLCPPIVLIVIFFLPMRLVQLQSLNWKFHLVELNSGPEMHIGWILFPYRVTFWVRTQKVLADAMSFYKLVLIFHRPHKRVCDVSPFVTRKSPF